MRHTTHSTHRRLGVHVLLPCLALCACAARQEPAPPRRITTWLAAQQDYNETLPGGMQAQAPVVLSDATLRQVAHVSLGGSDVRIKLSNVFGTQPVTFAAIGAARSSGGSAIDLATAQTVTFAGAAALTLGAGEEAWSDPLAWSLADNADVAVSLYVPATTSVASAHILAQQTAFVASGNATGAASLVGAQTTTSSYWLAGIDVTADARAKVVVTFGDSLTDGAESTIDANHRWPNFLDARLRAQPSPVPVSVVNAGIGGNRWLHDFIGAKGSGRFARDALGISGVSHVVIFMGINDIGVSFYLPAEAVTAQQIIASLDAAIAAALAQGIHVCVATLTPFAGAFYYTDEGEAKRQAVNAWIRANSAVSVVDFDAAVRDPANPTALLAGDDSGDHLHLTDAGYQRLADAMDLAFLAE